MVFRTCVLFALGFMCCGAAPEAGSLEEAENKIVERFAEIESLAATITNEESQKSEGKETSVQIVRQVEWMRKGAAFLYRAQTKATTTRKDGQSTTTREDSSTMVSDGVRVVRLGEEEGRMKATQRKADVTVTPDTRAMLDELRKDNTLKRYPDVKVGLDDCYAIQVLPKQREGSDLLQTMIFFRKDIGLDVRTVVYGKKNEVIFTSTTTNVKVNPKLPPDRFVLTIPDGVELIDESR